MNLKLLQNRRFWIIVIAIVLLVMTYRNWDRIIRFFQKRDIDFEPGEGINISDIRKKQIQSIAERIYNDIYDTPFIGHNISPYEDALALTDNELLFLSTYYRKSLTRGTSLKDDIQSEVYTFTDVNNKLIQRLNKIGE